MPSTRVFAGHRVRDLRHRLSLTQRMLAQRLGLSVSYLSQIENGDRPITAPVMLALARHFPGDWATIGPEEDQGLLVEGRGAAEDPSIPDARINADDVRKGVKQQPLLVRRMVALHRAYNRAQEQLRALDDRVDASPGEARRLPWEEVRDWFHTARNYVDAIDRRAETLAETLPPGQPIALSIEARLRDHGVRIALRSDGAMRAFDPVSRTLTLDPAQAPETTLFALAHQLIRLEWPGLTDDIARDEMISVGARELLSAGLANYAAGALVMPYRAFRDAAIDLRHDIDRLRQRFGTSFEQTCHRLSTLQRPGALGVPMFFCRVDMAGNITKRHSATRLQFARFGGACPLWSVHEAVAIPDRLLVQLAETPDGTRYVSMAKGLVKPSGSYARAPRRYAVALGCEISQAGDFVYADGLQLDGAATRIGISCRICPRTDCDQRAFPPAGSHLHIRPDRRGPVPYSFE
ncbi:MAG: short-chain fatty acyl-CoA regulator family protein [Sphingomonas bacterium]|nr:short-chain fatty acyl-CoA regulator family protein [Sphingomonas bacterium]